MVEGAHDLVGNCADLVGILSRLEWVRPARERIVRKCRLGARGAKGSVRACGARQVEASEKLEIGLTECSRWC
ncbi:MAG: hypothetical protein DYG94_09275 [Leptolyngbya sp. PLA3]|nr:MAG: hypothetical protein EDM82_12060 [Cyanobacteria bacterium CYA]MCE7968923.1 hypothetical protein [Leptolyngbya sp. PL-A3]